MISAIIPAYNAEFFLEEALTSIKKQQSPLPLEIIVVDDGSTDRTREIAEAHAEVRVFSQTNQGPAAARNRALREARGEYIAFLDADDIWPKNKLYLHHTYLKNDQSIDIVMGHVRSFTSDGRDPPYTGPYCGILLGSTLIRRELFESVGLFNPTLRYGEDLEWFMRAREAGKKICILDEVALLYRIHQKNMTHQKSLKEVGILRIYRDSMLRRHSSLKPIQFANPLVSVVVPVYNGERYLREALDSIYQQTYRPIEVIVVDDGSTDNSVHILKRYPQIIYLRQENRGVAQARIRGVEAAKGEFIAFLDQDDLWVSGKLKKQVNAFQADPAIQYVNGKVHYFLEEGSAPPPCFKQSLLESSSDSFLPSILMIRKELFRKIPIVPNYTHASDMDWVLRAREQKIPFQTLPDLLLRARIHSKNSSHDTRKQYGELLIALKASLDRKKERISIIVPVYNGEKYLKEALDTIFTQTHPWMEVIVVDDGSTDRTAEVAASFGSQVRIIRKQNGGIGAARNSGIEAATGAYLAFLDADDLWVESKLLHQLQLFRQDPELDMVFGEVIQFFSPDIAPEVLEKYRTLPPQMKCQFAGTMLIKRTSFEKVGLFSTTLQVGEYIDWYCRAQELQLKHAVLPELVLKRRIHGANTTLQKRASKLDYVRILHQSLQRRETYTRSSSKTPG